MRREGAGWLVVVLSGALLVSCGRQRSTSDVLHNYLMLSDTNGIEECLWKIDRTGDPRAQIYLRASSNTVAEITAGAEWSRVDKDVSQWEDFQKEYVPLWCLSSPPIPLDKGVLWQHYSSKDLTPIIYMWCSEEGTEAWVFSFFL